MCDMYTWARGRHITHLPHQPPVVKIEQQNKDDFEELGLGGDGAAEDAIM